MALSRTGQAVRSLKTIIEGAGFTNLNVKEAVIPTSSRSIDTFMKSVVTGNSTVVIMPKSHSPNSLKDTTMGRVQMYNAPLTFKIGVYSKFFMTEKAEDVLQIYDGLIDLLHNNGYRWLSGSLNTAIYDFNNHNYYEANLEVQLSERYPNR